MDPRHDEAVTDTHAPVTPAGGADEAPRVDAVASFDRHGAAVFASACRVTAGDRRFADDILRETFTRLQSGRVGDDDRSSLLLEAHRIYLDDERSDDDFWGEPVATEQPAWTLGRWGVALATLRGLAAGERVAINLCLLEAIDRTSVGALLGCTDGDVADLIEAGRRTLRATGSVDDIRDVLRHAEMWLGDDERDDVRVALGAPTTRRRDVEAPAAELAGRRRRSFRSALIGVGVVAIGVAVGTAWVRSLPDDDASQPVEAVADPAEDPGPATLVDGRATDVVNGTTVTVSVTQVDDAIATPDVVFMAAGLTDPAVVVPDAVVRYGDGKVGLSWHSPCNRPALAVAITNTATGAAVELTTGEYPIVSCIGMPTRWTAVVNPALPLPEGDITPIAPDRRPVAGFTGFVEAGAPAGGAGPLEEGSGYGAALVDGANQPWVYGLGCSSRSARYLSPIGAIFEIRRAEELDPASYSASDAIVCNDLATRPVLTGPLGAVTPGPGRPQGTDPVACDGPSDSLVDVPSARPFNSKFYDGDWSRWDGCLVRTDVIFSESLFETCAGQDVRTLTFAADVGAPIADDTPTLTYVRDPGGVVGGERPPFITYLSRSTDMYDSGLRYGDQVLLLSDDTIESVYIEVDGVVERWPRLVEPVSCV